MKLTLFNTIILVILFTVNAQSQSNSNTDIIGDWSLTKVDRSFKNAEFNDEANYIFQDAFVNHSIVNFSSNNTISLVRHAQNVTYEFTINANELTMIFYSKDKLKKSITIYNYTISNNQLVLFREDPIISEKYIFVKK